MTRCLSRHLVSAVLTCALLCHPVRAASALECDGPCQEEQAEAVRSLYDSLGAAVSATPATVQLPGHCLWDGVLCCTSNYTVDVSSKIQSGGQTSCRMSLGVAAIILPSKGLSGKLSGLAWAKLSPSLRYLDLTGETGTGLSSAVLFACNSKWHLKLLLHVLSVHPKSPGWSWALQVPTHGLSHTLCWDRQCTELELCNGQLLVCSTLLVCSDRH